VAGHGKFIAAGGALVGGLLVALLTHKSPQHAAANAGALASSVEGDGGAAPLGSGGSCTPRATLPAVTEKVVPEIAKEVGLNDAERQQVLEILLERAEVMENRNGLPRVRLQERDSPQGKAVEKLMADADETARKKLASALGSERGRDVYKRYTSAVHKSYPQGPPPPGLSGFRTAPSAAPFGSAAKPAAAP
jgi:hypothetical protein